MSSAVGCPPSTVIGYPIEYYLRRQPNSQPPGRVHPEPNRTQTTAAAAATGISRARQSDVIRSDTMIDDDDQDHISDGPCIILVVLIVILVLFMGVVGLFCSVNHGRRSDDAAANSFSSPKFQVESFSMSNSINISESSPLSWNIGFNITNPNEGVTFSYDDVSVYVVYRHETLSGTTLKPFNLGSKTSTLLSSNVVGSAQNLEEWALSSIERDVIAEGTVSFDVGFRSSVEFGPFDFKEFSSLKVYCEGLNVKFSSNATAAAGGGTMVTGSKDCRTSFSGS